MVQWVCIIGVGVVGLVMVYVLVCEGFDVILVEVCEWGGLEISYVNGGQLFYCYVVLLVDSGVLVQVFGWLLCNDVLLCLWLCFDLVQWCWLLGFFVVCCGLLNCCNVVYLLCLVLFSQCILQDWCEEDGFDGFDWWCNGKLVVFC